VRLRWWISRWNASQLPPILRVYFKSQILHPQSLNRKLFCYFPCNFNTKITGLHQDDLQSILQLGLNATRKMQRKPCRTLNRLGPNLEISKFRRLMSRQSTPEYHQCSRAIRLLIQILYYTDTLAILHTLGLAPQCRCQCNCLSVQRRYECQCSMKDPRSPLDR